MTVRSVLLGLLGASVVCGYTYFNDAVLRQSLFVGNHMPISVYGGLIVFLLLVNPLLRRISAKGRGGGSSDPSGPERPDLSAPRRGAWRMLGPLSARELVVILALTLAACCVPYSSMLRILPRVLMLPHHYVRTEPGWKWRSAEGVEENVLDFAPKRMLCDITRNPTEALDGFMQGMGEGDAHITVGQIPWYAWTRTLGFWLPLIVVLSVALIGLAVAVHRQWSVHERLPYPIVTFTKALLPEGGAAHGSVFRTRLFWVGAIAVFLFHLNNYGHAWFPEYLIPVPRRFDFGSLWRLFPTFIRGGGWGLISPSFYFSAIAIAFLLATDVSLAVGLGPFVFTYVGGVLAKYGIPMGAGTRFAPRIDRGIVFGGYVGVFLVFLYTGRRYYCDLLRRAFFLPRRPGPTESATEITEDTEGKDSVTSGPSVAESVSSVADRHSPGKIDPSAVWGARVFVVAMVIFVVDLCLVGLDWPLAVMYSALTVMIFLVMGRIIAETGLFFVAPYLYPCALISGVLGSRALGPEAMMIMFLLTCVLLVDPREALMPFIVNSVKLADDARVKLGRTAVLSGVAIVLGLAIAVPVTLYFHYDRGVNWNDYFGTRMVPRFPVEETVRVRQRLLSQNSLEEASSVRGLSRFSDIAPDARSLTAIGVGLAGVLVVAACRVRFAWWPLHPVFFLVWAGWAGRQMAWSFLIGCAVKAATTKYGGARSYRKVKLLMFGLIAGDMLGGIAAIVVGLVYYLATGEIPKPYWVMPF